MMQMKWSVSLRATEGKSFVYRKQKQSEYTVSRWEKPMGIIWLFLIWEIQCLKVTCMYRF